MLDLAKKDDRLVAITAAMEDGTGLAAFHRYYPDRFFDVGIAEGHGVTFAAGLAAADCIRYLLYILRFYREDLTR